MEKLSFEEALKKLEEIVTTLEKGDLPLEEALKLFEEGMKLSKFLRERLDEIELKIEKLVEEEGKLRTEPFKYEGRDDYEEV